jgi:hypothetical protein
MNVSSAVEITAEITTFLKSDERFPLKKCAATHPVHKVECEKLICTNKKHYGFIGRAPKCSAIVWEEKDKNETCIDL